VTRRVPSRSRKIRQIVGAGQVHPEQFVIWFGHLLTGDLGQSYYYKTDVTTLIAQRLEPTVSLALITIIIAVLVAVPLGVLAAWRFGGWLDRALMGFSVLGFSRAGVRAGLPADLVLRLKLGWLPVQGYKRLPKDSGPGCTSCCCRPSRCR
jgi:peptide/nickel transport system permease protein